jgi:hypothetical protein
MSKAKDEQMLKRAEEFVRTVEDIPERRARRRKDIVRMQDVAKRERDEAAKRLDL